MSDLFADLRKTLDATATRAGAVRVYPDSCFMTAQSGVALATENGGKLLCEVARSPSVLLPDFCGTVSEADGLALKRCPLTHDNAQALRKALPWTAPVSLRHRKTTIGCGDRLGRATPGHLLAVRRFDAAPVLAQQSIRELTLTGRTFEDVVDDVSFLVLQAGYTQGYGADGDHLKTLDDIGIAVDAGMAMITLDLSEVMVAAAEHWSEHEVERAFEHLPAAAQGRIMADYADRAFAVGGVTVTLSRIEAKRCAVMYLEAMDFAAQVYALLRKRRGDAFDLEISIDETQAPTLPGHHLFISKELLHRGIEVSSLAPRFIGEFQKAIDYIGDVREFESQFAVHCEIAKAFGGYKVSVHSGSDKFAVYPIIGKHTGQRVHVKTAGTSWLEAIRAIAECAPALYRDMHAKALASFPEALKYYHVTPDLASIPDPAALLDTELAGFLNHDAARQLLHVTYGFLLNDANIRARFFTALDEHEDIYYGLLEKHFIRHLRELGLPMI